MSYVDYIHKRNLELKEKSPLSFLAIRSIILDIEDLYIQNIAKDFDTVELGNAYNNLQSHILKLKNKINGIKEEPEKIDPEDKKIRGFKDQDNLQVYCPKCVDHKEVDTKDEKTWITKINTMIAEDLNCCNCGDLILKTNAIYVLERYDGK